MAGSNFVVRTKKKSRHEDNHQSRENCEGAERPAGLKLHVGKSWEQRPRKRSSYPRSTEGQLSLCGKKGLSRGPRWPKVEAGGL